MRIAVIPARGGSKRIPRKNIKPFAGKPIIAYPLQAARASKLFDHVLVSSDDAEILDIGSRYGGEPLVRPAALADDHAGTLAVMRHALAFAGERGWEPDGICCIYATTPFIRAADIRAGWQMLAKGDLEFCFSATTFPYPVFRGLLRAGNGVRMIFPEHFTTRSQDLPEAIHDAGQFYWGTPRAWSDCSSLFGAASAPLMLPRHRVQDIDTAEDWHRAELMYRAWIAGGEGAM